MDVNQFGGLWRGFMPARVVLTANSIGLFEHLKARPLSAPALARKLKADERATRLLLDALTGLGLVDKTGDAYANSPVAARFLLTGSPEYQGNIMRHAAVMWQNWSALDEVVQTGKPARKARGHEAFILGMHDVSALRAPALMRALPLKGRSRVLDMGGGPGTYAAHMARRGLDVTVFDVPETGPIFRKVMRREGVTGVKFKGGDFFTDPLGKGYDLALMSQILHMFSPADNVRLLTRAHAALSPGGVAVVQELPIEPTRTHPPHAAIFSINMLVNTAGGRAYHHDEIAAWLAEAGFTRTRVKRTSDTVLVMGTKPAR